MLNKIVNSAAPVTLLGAGQLDWAALDLAMTLAPRLVCADGGAAHAQACGLVPEAVIGDLDSLTPEMRAALPAGAVHYIAEQDSTDFDKALRHIAAPLVLAVAFDGSRMDHHLAALHVLVTRAAQRCILITGDQILFVAPPELRLDLPLGSLFSLFPMGEVSGRSVGLRWPIEGLEFAPDRMIGTSNEVAGPVHLHFDQAKMLVILPRSALHAVITGFAQQPVGWPAHAR